MKRPLVQVRERTPDAAELMRLYRESSEQDLTFVKGYSDKRHAIDRLASRNQPIPDELELKFRLHFVSVQKPNGRPDQRVATRFMAMGYKPVPWESFRDFGIEEIPSSAEKTPEGYIKVGDTVLYYTPASNAAKLEEQGRNAIDAKTSVEATASHLHQQAEELGSVGQGVTKDLQWSKRDTRITGTP